MYKTKTFFNSNLKVWHGPNEGIQTIYHPNVSVGEIIIHMLERNPNKVGQISASSGHEYTNSEIRTLSIRAAQNLQNYGIKQLDVVGLVASNVDHLAPLVFGAYLIGAPINAADPFFHKIEIKHIFGITRPKIIFCDKNNYEDVNQIVDELHLNCEIFLMKGNIEGVKTVHEFLKKTNESENSFIIPKLIDGGQQVHSILCSSGTTGLPKGVCISHELLLRHSLTNLTEDDVFLCFSTLYWFSGLITLITATINGACRVICDEPFNVDAFFNIVENYKVTTTIAPPSSTAPLIKSQLIETKNLASIKKYICGGASIPPILADKFKKYLTNGNFMVGYGMSETGFCTMDNYEQKTGSAGQLMPHTEVKIIDEFNKNQGINEVGEILIRGPNNWKGYYSNKEASENIYDEQGWIHSGDLGYFDEDGYLFIIDRKKECFKFKNYPIFPSEIEAVVLEINDVLEVCVCGIYSESIASNIPAAAIVKKPLSDLSESEIYEYATSRTSDFKKLRGGIFFFDNLPKTASGKIQRRTITEIIQKKFDLEYCTSNKNVEKKPI